jgi:hypothetical protein
MRSRAKEQLPSLLITLLSIVQALALELLWTRLLSSPYLWSGGFAAVLGWVQVLAMFLGILLVWLFYTSLVMRFRWVPSVRDSVIPFVIGLLEFSLIDLLGPGSIGPWLYALAIVFGVSSFEAHSITRRARRDPDNEELFQGLRPTTLRDHLPAIAVVFGLIALGLVVHVSASTGWPALVALVAATATLAQQIEVIRRSWNRTIMAPQP